MIKKIEKKLFQEAVSIINTGRQKIIQSIYNESTKSYYLLGKLIVEEEQKGKERASYGKQVIRNLSKKLTAKYGRGFSNSTLWDCQKFYKKFKSFFHSLKYRKLQSATGVFEEKNNFQFKLSFTHYVYLMRLENEEIKFYEKYAIKNNLSVRELQKAVQSNTILRIKQEQIYNTSEQKAKDIIKDPYILDFLGLDEIKNVKENVLENKIIQHLEKFLLELGRGFAFVGRQYRLTLSEDNFYVDLVFYNIPLKSYVIFELKTTKLKHQDLGQLQMYVNYFDREIKDNNDNSTIGVLLCSDKNDSLVKYTLPKNNTQIFASKYKFYLPSKKELQEELKKL